MPKMKTNRGAAKRFQVGVGGRVRYRRANRNHILTKKSPDRKRRLRTDGQLRPADRRAVARMLPYSGRS